MPRQYDILKRHPILQSMKMANDRFGESVERLKDVYNRYATNNYYEQMSQLWQPPDYSTMRKRGRQIMTDIGKRKAFRDALKPDEIQDYAGVVLADRIAEGQEKSQYVDYMNAVDYAQGNEEMIRHMIGGMGQVSQNPQAMRGLNAAMGAMGLPRLQGDGDNPLAKLMSGRGFKIPGSGSGGGSGSATSMQLQKVQDENGNVVFKAWNPKTGEWFDTGHRPPQSGEGASGAGSNKGWDTDFYDFKTFNGAEIGIREGDDEDTIKKKVELHKKWLRADDVRPTSNGMLEFRIPKKRVPMVGAGGMGGGGGRTAGQGNDPNPTDDPNPTAFNGTNAQKGAWIKNLTLANSNMDRAAAQLDALVKEYKMTPERAANVMNDPNAVNADKMKASAIAAAQADVLRWMDESNALRTAFPNQPQVKVLLSKEDAKKAKDKVFRKLLSQKRYDGIRTHYGITNPDDYKQISKLWQARNDPRVQEFFREWQSFIDSKVAPRIIDNRLIDRASAIQRREAYNKQQEEAGQEEETSSLYRR
jgi:hypothetical protein